MKQLSHVVKRILSVNVLVAMVAVSFFAATPATAEATTIEQLQQQIKEQQDKIANINNKIEDLNDQLALLQEQIDDLNSEILNTMTSISLKEEEIAEKEEEIAGKELEIQEKSAEIEVTQGQYDEAVAKEEYQYQCMVIRTRKMYEQGGTGYLEEIMSQGGLGDVLNRMDYIEKIYEYDRNKLTELGEIRQQVKDLWDRLEQEKQQLQEKKASLEEDKQNLEEQKTILEDQKADLDKALDKLKKESKTFENEMKKWQQEAAVSKKLLQQEQKELKNLQDAEKKRQQAANQTIASTSYTTTIQNAGGSELGKKIAAFGCQYIGNPYVYGGTSLTNGTDCSGFTYRVYQNFGYNLPRTSTEQRSSGVAVDYANAQPGDLICYSGHVGIYIGDGKIVHASSSTTGIIVSKATYRTILAVRRII